MNKLLILLLIPLIPLQAQNYYGVFFRDKSQTTYSLERPEEFLSPRSIQRKQTFSVGIDSLDLPVNHIYLEALQSLGYSVTHTSRWFNMAIITAENFPSDINELPIVDRVEYLGPPIVPPDEETIVYQTTDIDRQVSREFLDLHRMNEMHDMGIRGEGVWVAVLDGGFSGITPMHPYFSHLYDEERVLSFNLREKGQTIDRYSDHGTHVLSIIAANDENTYIGGAPDARYVLIVTEVDDNPELYEYRVEEYFWAIGAEICDSLGVDIINSSLGYNIFDDASMSYERDAVDGSTSVITRAANIAALKNMLCITSAGNEGNNSWNTITFPADAPDGIAVGGIDRPGERSAFSSYGRVGDQIKPEVVSFGRNIARVSPDARLTRGSGTSYSAPIITGLAAGLMQYFPQATAPEIRDKIISSGTQASNPSEETGYGIPDFIQAALGITYTSLQDDRIRAFPNPADQYLMISADHVPETVVFTNISGSQFTKAVVNGRISVADLPTGMYVLSIYHYTVRVVIHH